MNADQLATKGPQLSRKAEQLITPGTILIERGTLLPQSFRLENESYPSAWMSVKSSLNFYELEKELASAGWTFFYMAGKITTTALGFDRQKMVYTAVKRLIASVRLQKCNCLEIDAVASRSFWGMPYVRVSAHSRHIQKGVVFSGQAYKRDRSSPAGY